MRRFAHRLIKTNVAYHSRNINIAYEVTTTFCYPSYQSVEISYDTSDIRTVCEDELVAEKTYGFDIAEQLRNRLADLSAATNLGDMIAVKLHVEPNNGFRISLGGSFDMNLVAVDRSLKFDQNGSVKLNSVTRIKILSINSLSAPL